MQSTSKFSRILFLCALLILLYGAVSAYLRGGHDYRVYTHAGRLVLNGEISTIYTDSPDRFLYAPVFAVLVAPLAALPDSVGLAVLLLLKVFCLWRLGVIWARTVGASRGQGLFWVAAAIVLTARPVLIDLLYGQINLLLVVIACEAMLSLDRHPVVRAQRLRLFAKWTVFTVCAISKLILAPLLIAPVVMALRGRTHASFNRVVGAGIAFAVLLSIALPAALAPEGAWVIHQHWLSALAAKGLPLESHNQSFVAVMRHLLSSDATPIIAAASPRAFGLGLLPTGTATLLGGLMAAAAMMQLLWLLLRFEFKNTALVALAVGLLILPSHIVWKAYFVFTLPLAMELSRRLVHHRWIWFALFALINLTSVDILGLEFGARLEAYGVLLFCHLWLLVWVATRERNQERQAVL